MRAIYKLLHKQRPMKYSIFRTVLKRLFCVLSFTGCTYQLIQVSLEYFRYDILSEFYTGTPMDIFLPNISICGDLSVIEYAAIKKPLLIGNKLEWSDKVYWNFIDSSNDLIMTKLTDHNSHCATFVMSNQTFNCEY